MAKNKIKIFFDIDGVALNYNKRLCEVFKLFGGKTDLSTTKQFNLFNHIEESEHKAMMLSFGYMMNETIEMYDDFKILAKYIIEKNGEIHFITARQKDLSYKSARRSIEEELFSIGLLPVFTKQCIKIDCVGRDEKNMKHESKLPLLEKYGADYFVDDKRSTVLEVSKAGIITFLPKRSWNTLPDDTPNVIQYNSAIEIVNYFKIPN